MKKLMKGFLTAFAAVFLCMITVGLLADASQDPAPGDPPAVVRFPGKVVGNIDKAGFGEPSGLVFHPLRRTLFVAGDEGDLCEMKTDGTMLRRMHYPSSAFRMDFEGITVNPATGLLYIVVEGAEAILEIDPADLEIKRRFDIDRELDGNRVMAAGGQGVEGITFLPNPVHPHGGTFFVANQAFAMNIPNDLSAVFEVEVPLADKTGTAPSCKLLRQFSVGVTDLSDLHYDKARNRLYIISDSNDMIFETEPSGRVIAQYSELPCADQEGIAFDDQGNAYIAQDSGGVVKIQWPDR